MESRIATRLKITWIDAKDIITESKVNLGKQNQINYTSEEQILIEAECERVFNGKPTEIQEQMLEKKVNVLNKKPPEKKKKENFSDFTNEELGKILSKGEKRRLWGFGRRQW